MSPIREAATQARKYAHGCRLHQDAMTVLFKNYRRAFPHRQEPTLENLWAYVDGYLEMCVASHGPTPLG